MKEKKVPCRKIQYQKTTFEHKLFVIDQITNGQISVNYASKKYNISRSSINYWIKKYSTLAQQKKGMSKENEIKKLTKRLKRVKRKRKSRLKNKFFKGTPRGP